MDRLEEAFEKLIVLAREIEFEHGLGKDCGIDVIRYAVEDRVGLDTAVRSHRYASRHCGCRRETP